METHESADKGSEVEVAARQIVEEAWEEVRRSIYVQRKIGIIPRRFPDLSFDAAQRRTALGRSLLDRIETMPSKTVRHDLALSLRVVAFRARAWAREEAWYWLVVDPLGIGMYGMFLPTAYCGGWFLSQVHGQLASFSFETSEDINRYAELVADYGRLIEQFAWRTAGQAERGMRMPKVQVRQARELLTRLKANLRDTLAVAPERIAKVASRGFAGDLDACIAATVEPAFDVALEGLSDDYLRLAPETVGLSQYSGGMAVYEELVRLHTTLSLTPQEVYTQGQARMGEIQAQMSAIRTEVGFMGDDRAFLAHLAKDASWRANSANEITAFFQRYIERVQPRLAECFHTLPAAPCGVAPLPSALQGSMTYGYYDPPADRLAPGQYWFNASNLAKQALVCLGTLTYHELMPGHHLQLALQQESECLHPMRRFSYVTAYVEGWAEYAATLAGELGCYAAPEERYGRLVMDAFLTCRLIVDTGMNALGWSLDRARYYMREHTAMTEGEIASESIRYSCDLPGQGLAYKLGDAKILQLRELMRAAFAGQFTLKKFHAAVLETGALPLSDLEWHLEHVIDRWKKRSLVPQLRRTQQ